MESKVRYYGQYRVTSPNVKDVYQTTYKDNRPGKLWIYTRDGSHDHPTNKRYLSTEDELRHVVVRT